MADKKKILVVGDVMKDVYEWVQESGTDPATGCPVYVQTGAIVRPGGAANVAANVKSIAPAAEVHLLGIMPAREKSDFVPKGVELWGLFPGHRTVLEKRRVMSQGSEFMARYDRPRRAFPRGERARFIQYLPSFLSRAPEFFDAVVFSDYDKGTISQSVVEVILPRCGAVVVDSKRADLRIFAGNHILKLNAAEYAAQSSSPHYPRVSALFKHVVVTSGGKGTTILTDAGERRAPATAGGKTWSPLNIPGVVQGSGYAIEAVAVATRHAEVKDTTGCGDTHSAALAVGLVEGMDIISAVEFAEAHASAAAEIFGTCAVKRVVR